MFFGHIVLKVRLSDQNHRN